MFGAFLHMVVVQGHKYLFALSFNHMKLHFDLTGSFRKTVKPKVRKKSIAKDN